MSATRHKRLAAVTLYALTACALALTLFSASRPHLAHEQVTSSLDSEFDALSCADAPQELPLDEPLAWCADPSSPQCLPALPPHARAHLFDGQPALAPAVQAPPVRSMVAVAARGWEAPSPERAPSTRDREPLERPPRA